MTTTKTPVRDRAKRRAVNKLANKSAFTVAQATELEQWFVNRIETRLRDYASSTAHARNQRFDRIDQIAHDNAAALSKAIADLERRVNDAHAISVGNAQRINDLEQRFEGLLKDFNGHCQQTQARQTITAQKIEDLERMPLRGIKFEQRDVARTIINDIGHLLGMLEKEIKP